MILSRIHFTKGSMLEDVPGSHLKNHAIFSCPFFLTEAIRESQNDIRKLCLNTIPAAYKNRWAAYTLKM